MADSQRSVRHYPAPAAEIPHPGPPRRRRHVDLPASEARRRQVPDRADSRPGRSLASPGIGMSYPHPWACEGESSVGFGSVQNLPPACSLSRAVNVTVLQCGGPGCGISAAGLDGAALSADVSAKSVEPPNHHVSPRCLPRRAVHDPGLVKVLAPLRNAAKAAGLLMPKSWPW